MDVRAKLNRKPMVVVAVAAICIGVVVWTWFVKAHEEAADQLPPGGAVKAWYTVDDGRTWFPDAANKVVPFDHGGKPAYRCFVWTCDGGTTKFVSHLQRLSPAARQQLAGKDKVQPWELFPGSQEVKRPLSGDHGWVSASAPDAAAIQTPRCPDGKTSAPTPVAAE